MSEFTLKLLILAFPGIICYFSAQKLIGYKKKPALEVVLLIFCYSMFSYLISIFFFSMSGSLSLDIYLRILTSTFSESSKVLEESMSIYCLIIAASCMGLIISVALSKIEMYNLFNRAVFFLKLTDRKSDTDLWQLFNKEQSEWVFIRDTKDNLVYFCSIYAYSETEKDRELILRDISVYTSDNPEMSPIYELEWMYISRNKDEIIIEIPKFVVSKEKKK